PFLRARQRDPAARRGRARARHPVRAARRRSPRDRCGGAPARARGAHFGDACGPTRGVPVTDRPSPAPPTSGLTRPLRRLAVDDVLRLATLVAVGAFVVDWASKSWALEHLDGCMIPMGSL